MRLVGNKVDSQELPSLTVRTATGTDRLNPQPKAACHIGDFCDN